MLLLFFGYNHAVAGPARLDHGSVCRTNDDDDDDGNQELGRKLHSCIKKKPLHLGDAPRTAANFSIFSLNHCSIPSLCGTNHSRGTWQHSPCRQLPKSTPPLVTIASHCLRHARALVDETMSRRWTEDTWDVDTLLELDQSPSTSATDEVTLVEPLGQVAAPIVLYTGRLRPDTWDTAIVPESVTGRLGSAQEGSMLQTPSNSGGSSNLAGLLSWDDILSFGGVGAELVRRPMPQTAPQQAPSWDLEPSSAIFRPGHPILSRRDPSPMRHEHVQLAPRAFIPSPPDPDHSVQLLTEHWAQHQRHALSSTIQRAPPPAARSGSWRQLERFGLRVDHGPRFQPYQAPPVPIRLAEVQIPGRAELAAMEQIHGRPRPMSTRTFHQFRRAYGVPPDIAYDMRAAFMVGVHPSSLVYVNYERLASIPPQGYRSSQPERQASYWVCILTVTQATCREHIEHFLSEAPGPCGCHDCRYDGGHGLTTRPEDRWL